MHQNQVYVIQVNGKNQGPLALPAPAGQLLPSEVKYSASLVRGLGCSHLVLGAVLFLLGVLGSWVEPETCWSGAGIWGGIATIACGVSGIFAYHLWYKNYTIKAFLVTSVVCVVISILAIILIIYALINRHEHYYYLTEQAEKLPWFKPYNPNNEHQLTLSASANLLVGFILELILALWSVKIGWKGVRAEEFSSSRRDISPDDLQSVISMPQHNGQQVPLAALYQLIQAHPELLGSKNINGGLGSPWLSSLEERPSHRSMDYQERVSRYLTHAIEDQNTSFSRSPSTIPGEIHDNPSPTRSSSSITGSGGRGSPSGGSADTLVMTSELSPVSSGEISGNTVIEDTRLKMVTKSKDPKHKENTVIIEELDQAKSINPVEKIKQVKPMTIEETKQTKAIIVEDHRKTPEIEHSLKDKKSSTKSHITKLRNDLEPKGKAPIPRNTKETKTPKNEAEVSKDKEIIAKAVSVEHNGANPGTSTKMDPDPLRRKDKDINNHITEKAIVTEHKETSKDVSKETDAKNIKKSKENPTSKAKDEDYPLQTKDEKLKEAKECSSSNKKEKDCNRTTDKLKSEKREKRHTETNNATSTKKDADTLRKKDKDINNHIPEKSITIAHKETSKDISEEAEAKIVKKSKEKKSSKTKDEECHLQTKLENNKDIKESCSSNTKEHNNNSNTITEKKKSEKSEKHKSNKKEKHAHKEERDDCKDVKRKDNKEKNKLKTSEKTEESSSANNAQELQTSKESMKEKHKKSKKSKMDETLKTHPKEKEVVSQETKEMTEKASDVADIPAANKSLSTKTRVNTDASPKTKETSIDQVINIQPPSEFQDT